MGILSLLLLTGTLSSAALASVVAAPPNPVSSLAIFTSSTLVAR